ncbi:proton-conducting transporter membrane subunit [Streptomyces sp. ACA25]|uniref:hydrogen gas-evolving membrane-bound hydrogenase subunit E n=1 Tax=Streptomyces sp. ACA25 TaxID=3022596 RepID=UPI002307D68D|nr:hydrogen gas-evolving membrane-bound hydrogenase subunit E [Streptomyces sp. ACA25]MDB1087729.1 proton-conducting transporter membrane subunit [Streptomyces sp. ACA25]
MLLVVALAAMIALAAAVPAAAGRLGRNTGYPLAVGFLGVGLLLAIAVLGTPGDEAVTISWPWLPQLGVSLALRLDGLAGLFCLLILGVGALIMAYCPRYLPVEGHHTTIYSLLTLFALSMLGLVLAADLVLLVVFWELTTICSFFLIASAGPKATKPAVKAFLVTALGGLALLAAVVLLTIAAGTTDLTAILANREEVLASPLAWPIGALIIIAAFTKSAQLPFHSWLPGAMAAITPVSAYLHAATMVKAGIYLLMRFSPLFADQTAWSVTLVAGGLCTAVFGAMWALRQHDLKALLAYSTVSQLGLLTAAIGVGTQTAMAAAMLHTVAHALFKATLFMLVGIIDREAGSRDIRELSGLRRVMPTTALVTGLAGLSMAGVPPLLGFVSKEYLFKGFLQTDFAPWAGPVATAVAIGASALTFAYGLRIFYGAFGGPTLQGRLYEPAWSFLAPAAVPAVLGLLLGPAVPVLDTVVGRAMQDINPAAGPPGFALWPGFTAELAMSMITILAGVTLFLAQRPVERTLLRIPTPGALFERGYDGLLRFGAFVGRPERSNATAPYLVRPVIALVLLGGIGALALTDPPTADASTVSPLDWPVVAAVTLVVIGSVLTTSTLGALALLGMAGFLVSAWFLLAGAPDVALTLLLVEILTAIVAVLVITGLPSRFLPRLPVPTVAAGALAVAAGLAATGATLVFTGDRDISPVGDYFLHEAEEQTGGTNVVNTILVDFRALDTLGEAVVLGVVALGLLMLLGARDAPGTGRPVSAADGLVLQLANRTIGPVMLVFSAYLFLRGHNEPGGGFIAALVAGAAVALSYLARGRLPGSGGRILRPAPLVATGTLLSLGLALGVMLLGEEFFTPLKGSLPLPLLGDLSLTSSLLFDLGIYLLVLGLIFGAVDRLAHGLPAEPEPGDELEPEPAAAAAQTTPEKGTP